MNRVQKQIFEAVVKPSLDELAGNLVCVVRDFDNISQTGTITMTNSHSNGEEVMYDVPLMNIGGMKQSSPFPGDTVLVSFLGSSYKHPIIMGKADSKHFLFTRNGKQSHFRSGSNITDSYSEREGELWSDQRSV